MNRREMLTYTALLTGGALSASFTSVFLSGCSGPAEETSELYFFESDQFELLSVLTDTILPRTDSPSATDVHVHFTIDSMIGLVFDTGFKNMFRSQWAELESHLAGQNFLQLDQPAREEILLSLELNRNSDTENARVVYTELKQQTIAYYLATEEIGKEYLNYLPVPGEYEPCITVNDVENRAWTI